MNEDMYNVDPPFHDSSKIEQCLSGLNVLLLLNFYLRFAPTSNRVYEYKFIVRQVGTTVIDK